MDCAGVCDGEAVVDDCGVCDGQNASMDCSGVCDGEAVVDDCGVCDGDGGSACWDGSLECDFADCPDLPANYPDWDTNFDGVLDNYNFYEFNGSITSRVFDTDGTEIGSQGDMVACFVGDEQRGVGIAQEAPDALGGGYVFLMMVYSNQASGENLTFEYYNVASDEVLATSSSLVFETDMVEGNAIEAFEIVISGGTVELTLEFAPNWNWFSVNATQDDMDINSAFSGLPAQATDYIKSQTTAATYYDGFGFYPAFNVNVRNMYLLRLIEGGTMVYEGIPADPADNPITLAPNWNWIGYIPQVSMDVTVATANSPVVAQDYIKSQTTAATYYDGFGFYPTFNMSPTRGYMLQLANGGTLTYPSGTLASFIDGENDDDSYYRQYEFNGSISASVSMMRMFYMHILMDI